MSEIIAEVISSDRLELLPLQTDQASEMAAVLSDPALYTFTGGVPLTPQALHIRYQRLVAGSPAPGVTWCNWVIRLRDEGYLTGTVQATISAGLVAEISWVVGTRWQGRGIAKEAVLALIGWLRQQPVRTVIAHVHPEHGASAAVATAAGLAKTDRWHDGEVRWEMAIR